MRQCRGLIGSGLKKMSLSMLNNPDGEFKCQAPVVPVENIRLVFHMIIFMNEYFRLNGSRSRIVPRYRVRNKILMF